MIHISGMGKQGSWNFFEKLLLASVNPLRIRASHADGDLLLLGPQHG